MTTSFFVLSFSSEREKEIIGGEDIEHELDNTNPSGANESLTKVNRGVDTRRGGRKVYSCLKDIPLQIASESFSYFPMNDVIFAHKYGNQFLLKAAENHVEGCEIVQATLNISMINAVQRERHVDIKSKRISNKIKSLRVPDVDKTGVGRYHLYTESAKIIAALGESFENVNTIGFDGGAFSLFLSQDSQQLLEIVVNYKNLRQIN